MARPIFDHKTWPQGEARRRQGRTARHLGVAICENCKVLDICQMILAHFGWFWLLFLDIFAVFKMLLRLSLTDLVVLSPPARVRVSRFHENYFPHSLSSPSPNGELQIWMGTARPQPRAPRISVGTCGWFPAIPMSQRMPENMSE